MKIVFVCNSESLATTSMSHRRYLEIQLCNSEAVIENTWSREGRGDLHSPPPLMGCSEESKIRQKTMYLVVWASHGLCKEKTFGGQFPGEETVSVHSALKLITGRKTSHAHTHKHKHHFFFFFFFFLSAYNLCVCVFSFFFSFVSCSVFYCKSQNFMYT